MNNREDKKKKKRPDWGMFAAGFLWGITATFIFGVIFLRNSLICEYRSNYTFPETVKKVVEYAKSNENNWKVRASVCALPKPSDGTNIAALKLCQGEYASEIVNDENSRRVSAMIPCMFAVYEKSDGKTYISRLNLSLLGSLLGGKTARVFNSKIVPDQEEILKNIAE